MVPYFFTDAVWCDPNPPDSVKAIFENDYPTMGSVADMVSLIQSSSFELLDHFPLPPEAWWDNSYTPMEQIIAKFRGKYVDDPEVLEILEQLGLEPILVEEQMVQDPEFPTVKSPNPENAEALEMAIQLSLKEGADILMGTDPDCDRMGVAVKNPDGGMTLITGNQIGAILADYRISSLKAMGWIPKEGTQSAALIKTYVTSPLQDAIAKAHGMKVINTLTGFKWIG